MSFLEMSEDQQQRVEHAADYLNFLRTELPKLRAHKLPFYRKTRKSKHDTLRYILKKRILDGDGIFAEFGVFKGTTIRMIARNYPNTRIFGFDSFEGFPDDGRTDWKQDFSLNGQLPEVPINVELVKGYFDNTLKSFAQENMGKKLSLLHVDCDIYSSTKTIFDELSHMIQPGCVIVFDELLHYRGFENNEIKAFYEFLQQSNRRFEWLAIRDKVMDFETYQSIKPEQWADYKTMLQWRDMGYEQEVAVRIL